MEYKYCKWCDVRCSERNGLFSIRNLFCPVCIKPSDYIDAAQFEARVAVKMLDLFSHSDAFGPCDPCGGSCLDCMMKGCAFEALKRVRLMVEEEMYEKSV